MEPVDLDELLLGIRACRLCEAHLPLGPRPVVQASSTSRLLIVGQAPGTRVHASGVPWDDASGRRLRDWLRLAPEVFYDPACVAIVPMGFCYPGRAGSEPFLPDEALALEVAFAAYTSGSAWANHRDDAGVLAAGAVADLVVLDRDPFGAPPEEIGAVRVTSTWVEGDLVHAV